MKNKIPSTRNNRHADEEKNGANTEVSSNDDAKGKRKGRGDIRSTHPFDIGETGVNTSAFETPLTARVAPHAAHQYSSAVNINHYQDLRSRLLASGHSTLPDAQPPVFGSHQTGVPAVSTLQQFFQLQQQKQQTNIHAFPSLSAPAQTSTNLLSLLRQDQQRLVSLIAAATRPQQPPTGVQQQQLPISEQLSPLLSVLSQQHQRSFVQPVTSSSLQQNPFQPRLALDALAPLPVLPSSSSGSGNLPDALTALVAQNIFFGGIGHASQEGSTRNAQPTISAPSDKVYIHGRPSSPSQQQEQQRGGLPYALKKSPEERLSESSSDQRESQQGLASTGVPPHVEEDGTARDKGTMVLPCGARGMPQDHNFQVRQDIDGVGRDRTNNDLHSCFNSCRRAHIADFLLCVPFFRCSFTSRMLIWLSLPVLHMETN